MSDKSTDVIEVEPLKYGVSTIRIIGETPLIMHSMGSKAKSLLAHKSRRKSGVRNLRYEYSDCFYRYEGEEAAFAMPAMAFKASMVAVARYIQGVTMVSVRQLVHVMGHLIPIYGIPKAFVSIVRLQDVKRTPDVRIRPIFPRWCAEFTVRHQLPFMTANSVAAMVVNAGLVTGVGDFRPERGAGTYGTWRVVSTDDDELEFEAIKAEGGRDAQLEAEKQMIPYDENSADMLKYWDELFKEEGNDHS